MPLAPAAPAMPPVEEMPMEAAPPPAEAEVLMIEPPPDGYSKRAIKEIADGLQAAMDAISKAAKTEGGEVPEVPDELFEKGQMLAPLPEWLVEQVKTLIELSNQLGGKVEGRYAVDVLTLLATEAGVRSIGTLLDLVAKDKVLLQKIADTMRAKATMPSKPKEEEMVEEEMVEEIPAAEAEVAEMPATAYM